MPCTPRTLSASFTSSSLNGLRTATTSFTPSLPSIAASSACLPSPLLGPGRLGALCGSCLTPTVAGGRPLRVRGHPPVVVWSLSPVLGGEGTGRHGRHPLGEGLLGIDLLVVDGDVADLEDLVLLPQATADELHDHQDQGGDRRRPADDPDRRQELRPGLVPATPVQEA